jgi:hypothetical protein
VKSWRPDALDFFSQFDFRGTVFVPEVEAEMIQKEERLSTDLGDFDEAMWEWERFETATVIMFWVPRDLKDMPGFTTNIEWGRWYTSGKVVLGFPAGTPKIGYFIRCAKEYEIPMFNNLFQTVEAATRLAYKLFNQESK